MMKSFAVISFHLLYSYLFLLLLLLQNLVKADDRVYFSCNNDMNYTSSSVYAVNLDLGLNSLASNASNTGFYTTSIGQNLDTVYGLIQCKGDISKADCQICSDASIREIKKLCPNQKEASIGYQDCSLRYSNYNFFTTINSFPKMSYYNPDSVADPTLFNRQLGSLMKTISSQAASSPSRFAVGSIDYGNLVDIYGMLQCTQDLRENSCLRCLQDIIGNIQSCCDGKKGGRIYSLSCNLRYETYSFSSSLLAPPSSEGVSIPPAPPQLTQPGSTRRKKSSRTILIVVIPIASAAFAISVICCCFFWLRTKRNGAATIISHDTSDVGSKRTNESLLISLSALKLATDDFSEANKLGEGGFGSVYKGKLSNGNEIAVKRLSYNSTQGLQELRTEVTLVAKLLHRNLVSLLGFCLEDEEKLLVYEYMPHGSLDKVLFDQLTRSLLCWRSRYDIIIGIARGLLYLHEDSQLRIIHRDLKASNILLDRNLNPKISDFGLARLFHGSQTQGSTSRIAGTYGYMAPEYALNGQFSTKSDVYSFGIMVLELVTGLKSSSFCSTNLQSHAWQHWINRSALELVDRTLGSQWPRDEVMKCIHIGLLCVQDSSSDRPTMSEIAFMLSSYSINAPIPSQPAFFAPRTSFESDVEVANQISQPNSNLPQLSINDVTISELNPR